MLTNGTSTGGGGGGEAATDAGMEDARNMALLFFMDHLMQKNGRRTIHDLSCQFGARGFSDEMRQAVGGTQETLTEFLGQFPSLFKLEGDEISMMGYGDMSHGGASASPYLSALPAGGGGGRGRGRDYEREAVAFFETKLRRFGPEVPIKSLLGHRSQAPPEIRLLSGRHLKDFTDFLQQHTEAFIVEADRVRLVDMPEPELVPDTDLDENGVPLSGQRAKQAAVDFLRETVEGQTPTANTAAATDIDGDSPPPIPMDVLYQRFCQRFSHQIRQEVATNPKELLQFLKLNRSVFFIRSNKVSLVRLKSGDGVGAGSSDESSSAATSGESSDTAAATTTTMLVNGVQQTVEAFMTEINVVKGLKQAQTAVEEIVTSIRLSTLRPLLVMDMKVVNLGPQQEFLSVVVLGAPNRKLYVFDVAHSDTILLESGMKELLERTPNCLKVIHGGRRGCAILATRYGIRVGNLFDTQVAHAVSQHDKFDKPLHEVKPISFHYLQRIYYPESIMHSDVSLARQHQLQQQNVQHKCWSQRPMTTEMLQLVVEEAKHLPVLYRILDKTISIKMRPLFEQKCLDAASGVASNPMTPIRIKSAATETPVPDRTEPGSTSARASAGVTNRTNFETPKLTTTTNGFAANGHDDAAATSPSKSKAQLNGHCCCQCHTSSETRGKSDSKSKTTHASEMATQTLSTGEITMTEIYYDK